MNYSAEERKKFGAVQHLSRNGDFHAAAELLKGLVADRPDSAAFCAAYANVLEELGESEIAERYSRVAVFLSPASEKCSMGLFHSLWSQGKHHEALEEAKRYLSIADSPEYREMVREINEKWSAT